MVRSLKGMTVREAQMVLASSGYYGGAIDGDAGPATFRAVEIVEKNAGHSPRWSQERRLIGAVQRILAAQGYGPGAIDGYSGHNTKEALTEWLADQLKIGNAKVNRDKEPPPSAPKGSHWEQLKWPRQRDVEQWFGKAGSPQCTQGVCQLPFPFRLSWAKDQRVTRFFCHKLVEEPMAAIFRDAVAHYGENRYKQLQLDLFGGCYNNRNMRGGSAKSMHAYGIAVDLDPERNQLRWDHTRAAFARPEYEPFWRIVMANGATPAGYAWNGDWMHFQFARL